MIDAPKESRSVHIERDFAHAPEKLWRALTQPHLIQEWLMRNDFAPAIGHRFQLTGDWGGVLDCEVLEVEPLETLSYTWNFAHPDPALALRSIVTFRLAAIPGGTRLSMEQEGFQPTQKKAFGGAKLGWGQFFDKLDFALATTA